MLLQGVLSFAFNLYTQQPNGAFPAIQAGGRFVVQSANVLEYTRTFFGCAAATGADFENDGGEGTAGAHWEERSFDVCP